MGYHHNQLGGRFRQRKRQNRYSARTGLALAGPAKDLNKKLAETSTSKMKSDEQSNTHAREVLGSIPGPFKSSELSTVGDRTFHVLNR